MSRVFIYMVCFGLTVFTLKAARAQEAQDRSQYVHDRLVEFIKRNANRPIAAGDTFVGWWPNPVLYNTVRRTGDTVESSLVRLDTTVGTATGVWKQGRQSEVTVVWTHGDSTSVRLKAASDGRLIRLLGTQDTSFAVPSLPWVIADYGMNDQLLPLIETLPLNQPQQITVFRPFARKWDTTTVTVRRAPDVILADFANGPGDTDHWVITLDGALVQVTRDKYPNLERRPLERTSRISDYIRLRTRRAPAP